MGLKVIAFGGYGTGKTAFTASAAEVGPLAVCDTEQRWQFYTIPHSAEKPRTQPPPGLIEALLGPTEGLKPAEIAARRDAWAKVFLAAYAHPRMIRPDVPWLPKTQNPVWLLQSMDPIAAWNVTKVWARDPGIASIAKDSASVYWDILQDLRDPDEKLGGLAWAPIKRTDRRMTYTLLNSAKHYILVAHIQEKMNAKMEVTARVPWVEKKNPHWADLVLRFEFQEGIGAPRAQVDREKIAGGKGGALRTGAIVQAPTFKKVLDMTGVLPDLVEAAQPSMEQIEKRAESAVRRVAASPYMAGVDSDPKGE